MSFFSGSLFHKKIKSPARPSFTPGEKVIRPKTVAEVLGEAFDYDNTFSINSFFCKKLLKYCVKEYSAENLLFLLIYEKYQRNPSAALLNTIYHDFISIESQWTLNLPTATHRSITAACNAGDPFAALIALENVKDNAKINLGDTTGRLAGAQFDTAFLLHNTAQKSAFDTAIAYLKSHQIILK